MTTPTEIFSQTKVTIEVIAECVQCGDKIKQTETLDAHAIHTGNATQQAGYWHERMAATVEAVCGSEGWTMAEMAEGPRRSICGVCAAEKLRAERPDGL